MSTPEPSQAEAALSGIESGVQALAPVAGAALAVTNPQAAAVVNALDIATTQLAQLRAGVNSGATSPADATARATQIAAAIANTHAAWEAMNQPLPSAQPS